ncbi:DUF551 domain-containing protein [Salmonella enterica]|nr:DUF551 domain-containing protein [Salmonella enterica]
MTIITRERLLTIQQWRETYGPGSNVVLPAEEAEELARIVLASLEAEPVSQTYNLPELIEGMEVSIDVSTCDADAGNRYFGTVTEVSELYTAKNGYILLVQDAKPNFDVNGNSPVTPDGWVMVPKEPTQAMIKAWLSEVADWRGHVAGYKAALAAAPKPQNVPQNIPENIPAGKSTLTPDGWISCSERMPEDEQEVIVQNKLGYRYVSYFDEHSGLFFNMPGGNQMNCIEHILVTHWMPLPEPPQK